MLGIIQSIYSCDSEYNNYNHIYTYAIINTSIHRFIFVPDRSERHVTAKEIGGLCWSLFLMSSMYTLLRLQEENMMGGKHYRDKNVSITKIKQANGFRISNKPRLEKCGYFGFSGQGGFQDWRFSGRYVSLVRLCLKVTFPSKHIAGRDPVMFQLWFAPKSQTQGRLAHCPVESKNVQTDWSMQRICNLLSVQDEGGTW